jgi:hypothetical protein
VRRHNCGDRNLFARSPLSSQTCHASNSFPSKSIILDERSASGWFSILLPVLLFFSQSMGAQKNLPRLKSNISLRRVDVAVTPKNLLITEGNKEDEEDFSHATACRSSNHHRNLKRFSAE